MHTEIADVAKAMMRKTTTLEDDLIATDEVQTSAQSMRQILTTNLFAAASAAPIASNDSDEQVVRKLSITTSALKALNDMEASQHKRVNNKLRLKEQEADSNIGAMVTEALRRMHRGDVEFDSKTEAMTVAEEEAFFEKQAATFGQTVTDTEVRADPTDLS